MSGRFVRASKYRHVHGAIAKKEKAYQNVKGSCNGEGNYITANGKYFATAIAGGGGPIFINPHTRYGRLEHNIPKLNVHKGAVTDIAFSPFNDNIIATASEDATLKITIIPEDGAFDKVENANASLDGHLKKLSMIHFHPTASNVIASVAFDNTLRLWDIESAKEVHNIEEHTDLPQSFEWNENGSLIFSACKDRYVRLFDPRTKGSAIKSGYEGGGAKGARVVWFDNVGLCGVVGFSKSNSRQYVLYDPKKFDTPVASVDIDTSASVPIPYYDIDTSVLFVAGKGDATIHYYEVVREEPYIHFLSDFRDSESTKGCCFLPKTSCDTKTCEIGICYRVMRDWISPVSFQVPRKSADLFQSDIYPDTNAPIPSMTAAEYFSGVNKSPTKRSMKPGTTSVATMAASIGPGASSSSTSDLQKAIEALNAATSRIKELEDEVTRLKANK